ncbi:hypothetical protein [Paenibacillus spongiae]|uniref:Uncharacterized protein n=1 Tax=Paenibacillus spongiae TaxID=2909671 RepID=A0ABY5S9Y2_9BACL|nr:hypothetical protein [Paenibacillus spongiae]UVI30544.1 hypothetical protein L1F29_01230 [Paenibacillus spongiae]
MKLRNYLASLVIAVASTPSEIPGRGLRCRPRAAEIDAGSRVSPLADNHDV